MTMKEFMENGTQEQNNKLRACKTVEEVLALAKDFGIDLDKAQAEELAALFESSNGELSDEVLDKIAGGGFQAGRNPQNHRHPIQFE